MLSWLDPKVPILGSGRADDSSHANERRFYYSSGLALPLAERGYKPVVHPWLDLEEFAVQSVVGNLIADSLQLALNNAHRLLAGVHADQFARWATPGGAVVQSNHGAFVLGHLSIYAPVVVGQLGVDTAAIDPSERFLQAFSKDAQCQDDPSGTIYPPHEEIVERFFAGYETALTTLRGTADELFQQPNPSGGRSTELFPTLGSLHAFYAGGHVMLHLGQMSAWRRMLGLGAA